MILNTCGIAFHIGFSLPFAEQTSVIVTTLRALTSFQGSCFIQRHPSQLGFLFWMIAPSWSVDLQFQQGDHFQSPETGHKTRRTWVMHSSCFVSFRAVDFAIFWALFCAQNAGSDCDQKCVPKVSPTMTCITFVVQQAATEGDGLCNGIVRFILEVCGHRAFTTTYDWRAVTSLLTGTIHTVFGDTLCNHCLPTTTIMSNLQKQAMGSALMCAGRLNCTRQALAPH